MLTNVSCYDKIHTEGFPEIFRRGEGDAALPFARAFRAGLADYPFFAIGKEQGEQALRIRRGTKTDSGTVAGSGIGKIYTEGNSMKQMVALFLCLAMLLLLPACHAPDTETPGTTPPRESVSAPTGENASESGIASVTESAAGTEPGTEAGSATESATESVIRKLSRKPNLQPSPPRKPVRSRVFRGIGIRVGGRDRRVCRL